jgi:catechol 2,3-dioxygenase-like lactoylglutathione lyase family enzyme
VTPRGFAELVLMVDDVRASAAFYADVVGLAARSETDDEWAWFWAGKPGRAQWIGLHKGRLLFEDHSPLPPGERFGHVHFAFDVAREELQAAVERVRAAGVEVYGPIEFDWMRARSYYFYDPDGNLVEFWSPNLPEE